MSASPADGGSARAPRVSVVMAVCNGERWVREGVGSLVAQTHHDLELIVVDDGSTDRTAEMVRSMADPRIRLVHNERNLGLAASLNRGLALARGELVARQDVDDVSAPTRLSRQVAYLDAHPDVALVGSWYREIDPQGSPLGEHRLPVEHEDILWAMHFHSPFVHSAVTWRRVPVRDVVGGYQEGLSYSMDFDLWCRISDRFRVANLPELLLDVRVHEGSMTATYGERASEGRRMRAARVAGALDWEEGGTELMLARFDRLYSMMHGLVRARTARELQRDMGDLLRLHELFCRERGIDQEIVLRQRAEMARVLRSRLGQGARLCSVAGRRLDAVAHRVGGALVGATLRPQGSRAHVRREGQHG